MNGSINRLKSMLVVSASLCLLVTTASYAASPVGTWRTIDDNTGQPKSIVRIYQSGSTLQGKVVKLLPGATTSICNNCPGKLKGKPIIGMLVMWGYKPGSGGSWSGGRILDPGSGKVYKSNLKISPNGKALSVRGYLGVSAFGRTQTWQRIK